jgi:putative phosphonate metabolism protein
MTPYDPTEPHKLHRVAVYFAPRFDSDWWNAGTEWLGRCAHTGNEQPARSSKHIDESQFAALTKDPRRYGWHATLKPPFRLATGVHYPQFRHALVHLAKQHHAFELPPLRVGLLGDFLALRPVHRSQELELLANDCVTHLQPLASSLTDEEMARRRGKPLTPAQDELLQSWGYPWVLQEFRFHLSLTGSIAHLDGTQRESITAMAEQHFGKLGPLQVDHVSIFIEPVPGEPFMLADQIAVGTA